MLETLKGIKRGTDAFRVIQQAFLHIEECPAELYTALPLSY